MSIFKKQTKTLKDAIYETIHHSDISIGQLAERLDMGESYLYRAALPDPDTDGPNASGVRFPLKKVIPLCRITGDYQVLDVMEHQVGRVAIPLPKPDGYSKKEIQTKALEAAVEFGELIKEVTSSVEDGTITEKEQQRIDKEGREAIQAICLLLNINR